MASPSGDQATGLATLAPFDRPDRTAGPPVPEAHEVRLVVPCSQGSTIGRPRDALHGTGIALLNAQVGRLPGHVADEYGLTCELEGQPRAVGRPGETIVPSGGLGSSWVHCPDFGSQSRPASWASPKRPASCRRATTPRLITVALCPLENSQRPGRARIPKPDGLVATARREDTAPGVPREPQLAVMAEQDTGEHPVAASKRRISAVRGRGRASGRWGRKPPRRRPHDDGGSRSSSSGRRAMMWAASPAQRR